MRSLDVAPVGHEGLSGTAIGSAVHAELEHVDLAAPALADGWEERVRGAYPSATDEEVERIRSLIEAYCTSELAGRVAALDGVAKERHFTFEHDGVLIHGFLDTYHRAGDRALVVDYKSNLLDGQEPAEIVARSYELQRLVYALACFRAGAEEVEVAYLFLERPDEPVATTFTRTQVPELEAELSAAIARLRAGEFRPDAERVRMRRLSRARRRLRRAEAAVSAGCERRRRGARVVRSFVAEARRRVPGLKRIRVREIVERLAREHEDATIALTFRSPLELLVSVMLSAQTTDVNVNRVTATLFEKYHRPEDYLAVPQEELERDVFATGFYRQKAKAIRGTMRMLLEDFNGEVPRTLEELTRLPGVARKTANVVAAELGRPQGIVVDTHVRRLSQRLGLTKEEDPVKIERDLMKLVPREDWGRFPHLLIWHGRRVCLARNPRCEVCVLNDLCPSRRV